LFSLLDGYNDGRAHITVVTFLHKREFRPKALNVNWHKPREKKALEHVDHGRVLWLDVMTHEGGCISIIDIHRTTARQLDLQRHVNTDIQAEMKKSEGRWKIMRGDLNAATSRYSTQQTTSAGGAASCQVLSPGLSSVVSSTLVEGAPGATNLIRPALVPSPLHFHAPAH